MRTSALLFFTSACTLLEGARGWCTGKVRPFHHGHAHTGCHEVYVSCYTKFGDTCDYDFELPPWIGGYERVPELAGDRDSYYQTYPSTPGILTLTGASGGRLHCGSDDGSPQWKNYEDVVVCHKKTAHPTVSPTYEPTVSPTPAPTASIPLNSVAVRQALDGLCASLEAGEECRAEASGIMASLIAEATAEEASGDDAFDDDDEDDDDADDEEGGPAGGGGVDVAAAAGGLGRFGLAAALPFLLAAAVAVPAAAFVSSRFNECEWAGGGGPRLAYVPVPDAAGP